MELRQLKYFVTVAKTLNFSEAARTLYMTQGTLSQQIKQLEDEVGTQLFIRNSHTVTLSETGEELLPLAQKTLQEAENCQRKITDMRNTVCGTLSIGVTHSFSTLLTGTVREFIKKYPNVNLKIYYNTASELFEMLNDSNVDFVLAFKPQQTYDGILSEPLFHSRLSVIMRKEHPFAGKPSLTMDELKKLSIALPGSGLQARRAFERFINIDTSNLNIKAELNDPHIIMELLQGTNLVSILSSLAISYHPSLIAIPLEGVNRDMVGCVHSIRGCYHKRAGEIFLQMLRESAMLEKVAHDTY